jgi:hypothetical protein
MRAEDLLPMSLQIAVPLWLAELDRLGGEPRQQTIQAWLAEGKDKICESGDTLLYSAGKGEIPTRTMFNVTARAVAAMSLHRGGMGFAGLLFCARHSPAGEPSQYPCPRCLAGEAAA